MAKGILKTLVNLAIWLTGVIVSLAVGLALINGTLSVPVLGETVNIVAGWIVVVLTVLGVIGALLKL